MSLPDTLRDPRIRWDNITPVPFDVRLIVRPEERQPRPGAGSRGPAEIWQIVPLDREPRR
jgi:hypothetical protein